MKTQNHTLLLIVITIAVLQVSMLLFFVVIAIQPLVLFAPTFLNVAIISIAAFAKRTNKILHS
jgi:hypothetical protein